MAGEAAHGVDLIPVVSLLAAGVLAVPIFRRVGLGSILGYLAAGLVVGPYGFGVIDDTQTTLHVAELGVVLDSRGEPAAGRLRRPCRRLRRLRPRRAGP